MQKDAKGRSRPAARFALLACALAAVAAPAAADTKDALTGRGGYIQPLQQVIRVERARGPVYLTVPVAYVFGLGGGTDRDLTYCSPSVRMVNSSNAPIEELVVGIDFQTKAGADAGSAMARFDNVKIGRQDTQYFYQLAVNNCRGLHGEVSVVRCVYTSGEDCARDVQVIDQGTIPLRLKAAAAAPQAGAAPQSRPASSGPRQAAVPAR
jgi:hypothetical protein